MTTASQPWLSIPEIAAEIGSSPLRVEDALVTIGLFKSPTNSREDSGERVYSPAAVRLVEFEIRSASR